jgi:hypothetical protein
MCIRYTYFCHNCRKYFDVLLLGKYNPDESFFCWCFCSCLFFCCDSKIRDSDDDDGRSFVDCLCIDPKCLRRTEEGTWTKVKDVVMSVEPRCAGLIICSCHVVDAFTLIALGTARALGYI